MALAGICTITLSSSSCDNFLSVDGLTSSNVFYALIFVITSLSFQREHNRQAMLKTLIQRSSALVRCGFNVACPLGRHYRPLTLNSNPNTEIHTRYMHAFITEKMNEIPGPSC